jgi:23S rRNA-/tRNA-specific pseudouridylate synthase
MTATSAHQNPGDDRLQSVNDALRTRYWSWTLLDQDEATCGLLELLCNRLPHISPQSWDSRFAFGGIYVNGIEALADAPLPVPCKVEYYEPKFEIAEAKEIFPEFKENYVIFRDEHILVAYKPAGLSSMPAKEQRHFSLRASIEKLVQTTIHMPSRLDVSAQGIVLMSISAAAHATLQRAFEMRSVSKTYLCASSHRPHWEERQVSAIIGRDPTHPVLRTTDTALGKSAETTFRFLGTYSHESGDCHVMSARPITGRTHQIRVHAAHENVPLLGDRFYGGAPRSYLHLVAHSISCRHPISGKIFSCSLPQSLQPDWAQSFSDRIFTQNEWGK